MVWINLEWSKDESNSACVKLHQRHEVDLRYESGMTVCINFILKWWGFSDTESTINCRLIERVCCDTLTARCQLIARPSCGHSSSGFSLEDYLIRNYSILSPALLIQLVISTTLGTQWSARRLKFSIYLFFINCENRTDDNAARTTLSPGEKLIHHPRIVLSHLAPGLALW